MPENGHVPQESRELSATDAAPNQKRGITPPLTEHHHGAESKPEKSNRNEDSCLGAIPFPTRRPSRRVMKRSRNVLLTHLRNPAAHHRF